MKIVITGAGGVIGNVLMKNLSNAHEIFGIDKKEGADLHVCDIIREEEKIVGFLQDVSIVIHLAWDARESGINLRPACEENKRMGEIVFDAARKAGVERFILASSVHVSLGHIPHYQYPENKESHQELHAKKKIMADQHFYPLGTYGASKVYLEALACAYANRGTRVVVARFGNVTQDDTHGEYPFWLSHGDCVQFIEKCVTSKNIPQFSTFFAVSNNVCNPFDLTEAKKVLGYIPRDGTSCPWSIGN